jgi:hypothetical protein
MCTLNRGEHFVVTLELTNEQRQAMAVEAASPVRIVDPQTGQVYYLVPDTLFEKVQALLGNDLAETYSAQMESAMRAGWDDPVMDEYNDYDKHRPS